MKKIWYIIGILLILGAATFGLWQSGFNFTTWMWNTPAPVSQSNIQTASGSAPEITGSLETTGPEQAEDSGISFDEIQIQSGGGVKNSYPFNWKMNKPDISKTNFNTMINGFHDVWKGSYTIKAEDIYPDCTEYVLGSKDYGETTPSTFTPKEVKAGKIIQFTAKYNGEGFGFKFTKGQLDFMNSKGWLVFKPSQVKMALDEINYEGDGNTPDSFSKEERVNTYKTLGGQTEDYRRYPYNTIFVTTDLLLHIYHKIFDNGLKYYEETVARGIVSAFSKNMYNTFIALAAKEKNTDLKTYYDFLAAYRTLPVSVLLDEKIVSEKITNGEDYSDEELTDMIKKNFLTYSQKLTPQYQKLVQEDLDAILKAEERTGDILMSEFGGELNKIMDIKQDYTQFKPRSHYTTDSLLKTYFIAMKVLMRHKFYFASSNFSKASLILANNFRGGDLENFNTFYTFIQKLIGEDDDTNIYDIQKYIKDKNRKSDSDIISQFKPEYKKELQKLRPQKIMGTTYETPETAIVTENEAKDATIGFIFFGEKFTIDSWIFDQLTAGSSEKEYAYKDNRASTLIIPAIVSKNSLADQLVNLRMKKHDDSPMSKARLEYYNSIKNNKDNIQKQVDENDYKANIYHKWLRLLDLTNLTKEDSTPYFMADPLYQYKNLNAYLGSYTELKHDTLLYVKQAYAELGGGGGGDCSFAVTPPALPVPKGYVDPNIMLIDRLITLNKETDRFFKDPASEKFGIFLEFIKPIATSETKNEKIPDETFEKLRLYYDDLTEITTPRKAVGEPLQKEFRGSIIADIFNSGEHGPLYIADGRPYMIAATINDTNGSRVVLGPIYSTYEFYGNDSPIKTDSRLTDENRQNNYDKLSPQDYQKILSLPLKALLDAMK